MHNKFCLRTFSSESDSGVLYFYLFIKIYSTHKTLYKFKVYNAFIYYDMIGSLAIVNNSIKSHDIYSCKVS